MSLVLPYAYLRPAKKYINTSHAHGRSTSLSISQDTYNYTKAAPHITIHVGHIIYDVTSTAQPNKQWNELAHNTHYGQQLLLVNVVT